MFELHRLRGIHRYRIPEWANARFATSIKTTILVVRQLAAEMREIE